MKEVVQRTKHETLDFQDDRASYRDLLSSLVNQTSSLVKGEIALAKAELRDKLRTYLSAASVTGLGIVFGLISVMSLAAAAIVALAPKVGSALACVLVGGVFGVVAVLLATYGLKQLER